MMDSMYEQLKFDVKAFLGDNWPNATGHHTWLRAYGLDIDKQAVFKQYLRASIPAGQFATVLALLELERGAPVSLAKYLK